MDETTRIKIVKGRRPTLEQLRQAALLARQRGHVRIALVDPETGSTWAEAKLEDVQAYISTIESVQWPFSGKSARNKVIIE